MNRDERQAICIEKWKAAKGKGIMLLPTGFGKTRTAIKICEKFFKIRPEIKIVVVVPSDNLKKQWLKQIVDAGLHHNTVIDTVHTLVKRDSSCNLLILDEVHMYASDVFIQIFERVKSNFLLGLTGTLNRLDGKEQLILNYMPVVDHITLPEAVKNGWVSEYIQYKLEIEVDLTDYKEYSAKFLHHFAFFGHNFDLAMACLKDVRARIMFASRLQGKSEKDVLVQALGFSKAMRQRKDFIYNHPRKIELVNKIIAARSDRKIITFTKSVKHARLIEKGEVYHGDIKPQKEKDRLLKVFNEADAGVLNTCKAVDMGTDLDGVNVAVIISGDSSQITKAQRIGRALRYSEGKIAELWSFVLKGTAEEGWFDKANNGTAYTTIYDYQLDSMLIGENYEEVQKDEDPPEFLFIL